MLRRMVIPIVLMLCTALPTCAEQDELSYQRSLQLKYQAEDLEKTRFAIKRQLDNLLSDRDEILAKIDNYNYKLKNVDRSIKELRALDDRLFSQLKIVDAEYHNP